jgi:hypothetical protein
MSGALVQLVSKGAQDIYLTTQDGMSFFNLKYSRHTNFAQAPKFIKEVTSDDYSISIPVYGDLLNSVWFEGTNLLNKFFDSTIDLYIGGQKVDSYGYDYISDIWQNYLADTYTKSQEINNKCSTTNPNFLPLHFFFCDNHSFLPLIALQYHQVEIRINFKATNVSGVRCYGNYIFLDTHERQRFTSKKMDFIITQVQNIKKQLICDDTNYFNQLTINAQTVYNTANTLLTALQSATPQDPSAIAAQQIIVDDKFALYQAANVLSNRDNTNGYGYNDIDISQLNHPVKSIFFGFTTTNAQIETDKFSFSSVDMQLNGTPLFENMSPLYFHIVQNYNQSRYGIIQYDEDTDCPFYTRYFAYHFCMNASEYKPTGTCNFSRLDNAKLILRNAVKGYGRPVQEDIKIYAVGYNILRIDKGMAGILFAN